MLRSGWDDGLERSIGSSPLTPPSWMRGELPSGQVRLQMPYGGPDFSVTLGKHLVLDRSLELCTQLVRERDALAVVGDFTRPPLASGVINWLLISPYAQQMQLWESVLDAVSRIIAPQGYVESWWLMSDQIDVNMHQFITRQDELLNQYTFDGERVTIHRSIHNQVRESWTLNCVRFGINLASAFETRRLSIEQSSVLPLGLPNLYVKYILARKRSE